VSVDPGDCLNCGAKLAADAWFCGRCGSPVPQPGDEEEPDPPSWRLALPELPPAVRLWGPRVAAGALILFAAATALFAMLVLLFGVFVES